MIVVEDEVDREQRGVLFVVKFHLKSEAGKDSSCLYLMYMDGGWSRNGAPYPFVAALSLPTPSSTAGKRADGSTPPRHHHAARIFDRKGSSHPSGEQGCICSSLRLSWFLNTFAGGWRIQPSADGRALAQ